MVGDGGSPLKLHVFDVGHGDSLLLEFPERDSFAIIDCNQHCKSHRGFGEDYNPHEPKVLTYLRHLVDRGSSPIVEFACLTHAHIDHYRGYGTLLEGLANLDIQVKSLWDFGVAARKARAVLQLPDIPPFAELKDEMAKLLRVKDVLVKQGIDRRILVNPVNSFWAKGEVEIDVLAPHANQFETYANYLACDTAKERQQFRRSLGRLLCRDLLLLVLQRDHRTIHLGGVSDAADRVAGFQVGRGRKSRPTQRSLSAASCICYRNVPGKPGDHALHRAAAAVVRSEPPA